MAIGENKTDFGRKRRKDREYEPKNIRQIIKATNEAITLELAEERKQTDARINRRIHRNDGRAD